MADPQRTVIDLARRVLGDTVAESIDVVIERGPHRGYAYECTDGRLKITATDAGAAAVGLRTYLRAVVGRDVQWATRLPLEITLRPCEPVSGMSRVAEQYMYNFCTYSYSTPHWTWVEWERELDWMAMHGITMPLALVGHEAVLAEAWRRLGVGDEEVLSFLGDPVYVAFQFMGCLDGRDAVVTPGWLDERRALGTRILERARELGMRPILPAFTGHVPTGWADDAASERDWQGNTTKFLDPADDRFPLVAAKVAEVQSEFFGSTTHFAADPFIEMIPVDGGTDFPALVGRRLLQGIESIVPGAVWVMQAWPFSYQRDYWSDERIAAFLDGIDADRLLVLDLWAEADPVWPIADGFRGKDWHWCGLLNFGGRSDGVADLRGAVAGFERALASSHPPSGIGLSMESFHHNAVFFELLCDLAWQPVEDVVTWAEEFAVRRYGVDDPRARDGWAALAETVYDARQGRIFPEDFHGILTKRADLLAATEAVALRERAAVLNWFDPGRLLEGWVALTELLEERPGLGAGPLGLDLVEVAQAAGVRVVDELAARVLEAADDERADRVDALLGAIDALDAVVATREETRLDAVETLAERAATHDLDASRLVQAQRRILTSWNAAPGTDLDDYSGRIWHGLVGSYYRRRLEAWARMDGTRLADDLDGLWTEFMKDGASFRPADLAELAPASRALQVLYRAVFA